MVFCSWTSTPTYNLEIYFWLRSWTSTLTYISYRIILVYKLSPLNWIIKKRLIEGGKNIGLKASTKPVIRWCKLWHWKHDSRNKLCRCRFKIALFFTNYLSNCSIRSRLSTCQVFPNVTLNTFASNYLKMYREPIKWRVW